MSDPIRDAQTFIRQSEELLADIGAMTVEKSSARPDDVSLPGAESISTLELPQGVEDLSPDYPGVRKVGAGRRVFHLVPPLQDSEEWHLTNTRDDILFSAREESGLMDALSDMVTLTKPGQESKDALEGRSRPLTMDEAVEHLLFLTALEGVPVEQKVASLGYVDTDPDPSPKPGARRLRHYWTRGEGALKIKWGLPGDWRRCVRHLRKYVGTGAEGLCNVFHTSALGAPPGKGH